ncbi:hypothetical protein LSAT2_021808 [Lamellibrachia satsuma]|nr:hypothetical protein LSAT2_021808 [Lamellibrachia satsuma]
MMSVDVMCRDTCDVQKAPMEVHIVRSRPKHQARQLLYRHHPKSPMIGTKQQLRCRSVPLSMNHQSCDVSSVMAAIQHPRRPHTAVSSEGQRPASSCERLDSVEHEPTRKHQLSSHLPLKKNRFPPWQKNLEAQPVPWGVGPGYVLSKSKNKIAMYIKAQQFFDAQHVDENEKKEDPERTTQAPPIKQLTSSLRFPPSGSVSFVDTFSKVPGCDKLNFVRSLQKLDAYSTHDNWTAESVSSCPCIGQGSLRRFQLNLARTALTPTLYEWRSDSGIRLHLAPVPPPSRSSSKLRTTWSATNSSSENRGRTTPVECPSFSVDTEGDQLQPCRILHRPRAHSATVLSRTGVQNPPRAHSATVLSRTGVQNPPRAHSATVFSRTGVQNPPRAHSATVLSCTGVQNPPRAHSATVLSRTGVQNPPRAHSATVLSCTGVQNPPRVQSATVMSHTGFQNPPRAQSATVLPRTGVQNQPRTQSVTLPKRTILASHQAFRREHPRVRVQCKVQTRHIETKQRVIEIKSGQEEIGVKDDHVVCQRDAVPRLRYYHAHPVRDSQWSMSYPVSKQDVQPDRTSLSDVCSLPHSEDHDSSLDVEEDIFSVLDDHSDDGNISLENNVSVEQSDGDEGETKNATQVMIQQEDVLIPKDLSHTSRENFSKTHDLHIHLNCGHCLGQVDYEATDTSHDSRNTSPDITSRSHDATDGSPDVKSRCHDATCTSHDHTGRNHDATGRSHDVTSGSKVCRCNLESVSPAVSKTHVTFDDSEAVDTYSQNGDTVKLDSSEKVCVSVAPSELGAKEMFIATCTSRQNNIRIDTGDCVIAKDDFCATRTHNVTSTDQHTRMLHITADDASCVKERHPNVDTCGATEQWFPPSTNSHQIPTATQAIPEHGMEQGNIPSATDSTRRHDISISVSAVTENMTNALRKDMIPTGLSKTRIPAAVNSTHGSHVDVVYLTEEHNICVGYDEEEKDKLEDCVDTNRNVEQLHVSSTSQEVCSDSTTLANDLLTSREEKISDRGGGYENEANSDVTFSQLSSCSDSGMVPRTQQIVVEDSSFCEMLQDCHDIEPTLMSGKALHGANTGDILCTANHDETLSDHIVVTSDSESTISNFIREGPMPLKQEGIILSPDGAVVESDGQESNSDDDVGSTVTEACFLSAPDISDLFPNSGEDITLSSFVTQERLQQIQDSQNLPTKAASSDIQMNPVFSDMPRMPVHDVSSESKPDNTASSKAKRRHVPPRVKSCKPSHDGRRRQSVPTHRNKGVRPEHDTFKIQSSRMRRDISDLPRSARTHRDSLYSHIPVIVLTSDTNEVTYLNVKRRMSHDAYCYNS